jgi:hypothetical protein
MAIDDDVLTKLKAEPLSEVTGRIRDGDLLLCAGTSPISRAIRLATRSPWSHVALAYRWHGIGRLMVFESVEHIGVRTVPLSNFVHHSGKRRKPYRGQIILARHEDYARHAGAKASAKMQRLADFAVDRFGSPFAALEVLKIGLRITAAGLGMKMPPSLGPDDEFICSEYVAKCYENVGIEVPWDKMGFIAPADFARDPKIHALARISTSKP